MDQLSPRDIEAILSGRDPEDPAAEPFSGLVKEMRQDFVDDPTDDVAAHHLAAMKDAASEAGEPSAVTTPKTRRKWMRFRGQRRLAGLAAAAVLLLGAGVATAVVLPDQASDTAKDAVESADQNAEHGQDVSEIARDPAFQGCEKGQAVAGQASSKAAEHRQGQGPQEDPCARGEKANSARGGGEAGAQEHGGAHPEGGAGQDFGESVSGRATGGEPQDGGRAFGESVSEEAKQLVPRPAPQATPQGGRETGESASQQGQQTGGSASQGGRETAGGASGGRAP